MEILSGVQLQADNPKHERKIFVIIEKMLDDLRTIGVREGGILLVHSSFKSLGITGEGAFGKVIATLRAALGEHGTLILPTLSYASVPVDNRVFDVLNTPSDVGALSEFFRKQEDVVRSFHPTHSVAAAGALAVAMTINHDKDSTPVGEYSPFRKLRDLGGQILMLGCGLRPNTSMHGVEELTNPPYLFKHTLDYKCTDASGNVQTLQIKRHNFENKHGEEIIQRYDRLKFILPGNVLAANTVLSAQSYLIEAKPMWDIAELILKDDPLFFVDAI
jgi:aminoglycoside 3-N-acetyltransferase